MTEDWDRSGHPTEFLVSAELYVPSGTVSGLRKPTNQRKRVEKREGTANGSDDGRKLKEKSSWLALSKGSTGIGHWRPATCKLSEDGERCLLNIYVDESILYQTVYVHLLNQTDVRQADSSLFFRKECIGIYCAAGQRWTSVNTTEPIYLQFASPDLCNTWFSLLRSYAIPEIYGRWFNPADGGSYRMWRQVELTVIQGRGLGSTRPPGSGFSGDSNTEPENADFCEIRFNDILCGLTTVKKGMAFPDWHENFVFSDLPPFESLVLLLCREKKLSPQTTLGSVRISLANFRRGETVEGWFPVLHESSRAMNIQVGEVRLKIRVDEEIILPYSAYSDLLKTLNSRNILDWMSDFESKLKLKTVSSHLIYIAIATDRAIDQVQDLASREVDGTPSSHQTLFRGNTILTKVMELCMAWYGKAFLEASIGGVLRRLCAEKIAIEVDPLRSGKGSKDLERSVEQLIYWCREFWNQIYSVRTRCPQEMRRLFETIRVLVEKRYRSEHGPQENRELPWQSVSAFCFLRFIVPAILHPHLFGLCPGLPAAPVQRSLTLIAKVIQSLANLNLSVQKEEFMKGVKDFLKESVPAMVDYILVVSTPANDHITFQGSVDDMHDRLEVINHLRQRASTLPVLDKEAVPVLPHLLDIPRHLAIITSAVIRNSREFQSRIRSRAESEEVLDELFAKCFDVEEHALRRVSQLASKIVSERRPSTASPSISRTLPDHVLHSPSSPSSPSSRRPHRSLRPSTAPSPAKSFASLKPFSDASEPLPSRLRSPSSVDPRERGVDRRPYPKSPSSDSLPYFSSEKLESDSLVPSSDQLPESEDGGRRVLGIFRRGILRK